MNSPTKTEEIAILREAAAKLGAQSYCGPWLTEQIDGIARDITSDFFPQISREATIRDCERMRVHAEERAAGIVATAEREAAVILTRASKAADGYRGSMAEAARQVLRLVNS